MSYRFMRIIVFFDLPTETASDKSEYRSFRKLLIKNGFIMLQESVYSRIVLNPSIQRGVMETLRKNRPSNGLVQALTITERQFASMEFLVGEHKTDVVDTDERMVIL